MKAIHGLRIAPEAWGVERDKQLNTMEIKVKGKKYVFLRSHIDPSVWMIVRGSVDTQGATGSKGDNAAKTTGQPLHECFFPEEPESAAFGYLVIYVDDFLVISDDPFIDAVRDKLRGTWQITDKPTVNFGSGLSVEYLSVHITADKDGWFLDQAVYCQGLPSTWYMDERRAVGSL